MVPVDQEGCRSSMLLSDVLDAWRKGEGQKVYVKDWHLALQRPQDRFYDTPDIFKDDWMNRYYCAETDDDFRFVVRTAVFLLKGGPALTGTTPTVHGAQLNLYSTPQRCL